MRATDRARRAGGAPRRRLGLAVSVLLAVVIAGAASCQPCRATGTCQPSDVTPGRPNGPLVPLSGAYLGAFSSSGTWNGDTAFYDHYRSRESAAGRRFDIGNHFYSWDNPVPTDLDRWDLANGRIPMITWEPTIGLTAINNGSQDAKITSTARSIKALGQPVFLRFGHEMNGNWYPWDGTHNNDPGTTNGPAKYVRAWKRVHDLFRSAGATNVVWVWSLNNESVPNAAWNSWTAYYPGDAYVDWVAIDGYNWSTTREWGAWKSFETLVAPIYDAYAARKPIMISETASVEQGGSKAQWIREITAASKTRFPSIGAVLWFDENKENDWRFDSSATARTALRELGADTWFRPSSGTSTSNGLTPAASVTLRVSPSADLSGAVPLQSATLTGNRFIRADTAGATVTEVTFYLDDPTMTALPFRVETWAPYDLAGGEAFTSSSIRPGIHTLTAVTKLSTGTTVVTRATFTTA